MSHPPLIFGPIPPYNNPPIEPQNFQPSVFNITTISLGITTTVTTSVNHNYVIGQEVRLLIPSIYGPQVLNEQTGFVLQIPALNEVVLNINSQNVTAFNLVSYPLPPQIVAVGNINTGSVNPNGPKISTLLPGSFSNIS